MNSTYVLPPSLSLSPLCRFMGCSGQNVDDIYKFSSLRDRLKILENTLHWRHMLPTSPDTLSQCVRACVCACVRACVRVCACTLCTTVLVSDLLYLRT